MMRLQKRIRGTPSALLGCTYRLWRSSLELVLVSVSHSVERYEPPGAETELILVTDGSQTHTVPGTVKPPRPHPISLDTASPNGGMAVTQGGRDGEEADESQAWCGRVLGTEWAGGVAGAMERPAEDGTGPAPAPG